MQHKMLATVLGCLAVLGACQTTPGAFLSGGARVGYSEYEIRPDFKAFALAPSGVWGSGYGWATRREAVERALSGCAKHVSSGCEVYAVGNIVVRGMAAEDVDAIIRTGAKRSTGRKAAAAPSYSNDLIDAARDGDSDRLETVLAGGTDVNARNSDDSTALIEAVRNDGRAIVMRLIEAGADVSLTDNGGESALTIARKRGNSEILTLLLDPEATRRLFQEEKRRSLAEALRQRAEEEKRRLAEAERQRLAEDKRRRIEAEAKRLIESGDAAGAELRRQLTILRGLLDGKLIIQGEFEARQQALLDRHLTGSRVASTPMERAGNPPQETDDRLAAFRDVDFGDYHALVIGNDVYANLPRLKTAVADARAVAAMLRDQYGFRVKLMTDAGRDDLLDVLDEYRETLVPGIKIH